MSGATSNLYPPKPYGPVLRKRGDYLTDGRRLFWVMEIDGECAVLEDVSTECLERWRIKDAMVSLREVKPSPPA